MYVLMMKGLRKVKKGKYIVQKELVNCSSKENILIGNIKFISI